MVYFSGTAAITSDEEGRYRVPSKFRNMYPPETKLCAFKNDDRYLSIISRDKADEIIAKLSSLISLKDNKASEQTRKLLANIEEIKEDSQYRFCLSPEMKNSLGLGKEVVFVGVSTKLEMWDKKAWDEYMSQTKQEDFADILTEISF